MFAQQSCMGETRHENATVLPGGGSSDGSISFLPVPHHRIVQSSQFIDDTGNTAERQLDEKRVGWLMKTRECLRTVQTKSFRYKIAKYRLYNVSYPNHLCPRDGVSLTSTSNAHTRVSLNLIVKNPLSQIQLCLIIQVRMCVRNKVSYLTNLK
jgi:hypothetical protein